MVSLSPALREASSNGNVKWVQILLKKGASTDAVTLSSYPIFGAALNGHTDIVKLLLEAGSPNNPTDKENGKALYDVLKEYEKTKMIELLNSHNTE